MDSLTIVQATVFGSLLAGEAIVSYFYNFRTYEKRDTLLSLSIGIISAVVLLATTGFFFAILLFISRYGLFNVNYAWYSWVMLLIICDISYYFIHLFSHKVRFLWASHMIHHSSHLLNYTTIFRGPVIYLSFRMIFWIPMVLLGFPPAMIIVTDTVIQMYTVFTHTTVIGRLGALEYIFNTPAHHRLHHSMNPEYMDKNFGGMFIVWDRMFGTLVEEKARPVFGLRETQGIHNPLTLIFLEWKRMARDLKFARTWPNRWNAVFGKPTDCDSPESNAGL